MVLAGDPWRAVFTKDNIAEKEKKICNDNMGAKPCPPESALRSSAQEKVRRRWEAIFQCL